MRNDKTPSKKDLYIEADQKFPPQGANKPGIPPCTDIFPTTVVLYLGISNIQTFRLLVNNLHQLPEIKPSHFWGRFP